MIRFNIVGTTAVLALMFATPVFAQAAVQEPGAFSFYYPNNDVLNGGEPTPAERMDEKAGLGPFSGSYAYAPAHNARARRYRSYEKTPGSFPGYHAGR